MVRMASSERSVCDSIDAYTSSIASGRHRPAACMIGRRVPAAISSPAPPRRNARPEMDGGGRPLALGSHAPAIPSISSGSCSGGGIAEARAHGER